jgi:hypothetical protein
MGRKGSDKSNMIAVIFRKGVLIFRKGAAFFRKDTAICGKFPKTSPILQAYNANIAVLIVSNTMTGFAF